MTFPHSHIVQLLPYTYSSNRNDTLLTLLVTFFLFLDACHGFSFQPHTTCFYYSLIVCYRGQLELKFAILYFVLELLQYFSFIDKIIIWTQDHYSLSQKQINLLKEFYYQD